MIRHSGKNSITRAVDTEARARVRAERPAAMQTFVWFSPLPASIRK